MNSSHHSRRIASSYLLSEGRLVKNPLVTLDDKGRITSIESYERLDSMPCVEFYAGVMCAGLVNAHPHIELSYLRGAIEKGCGFSGFAQAIGRVRGLFSDEERQRAILAADAEL